LSKAPYGNLADGTAVDLYTLENVNGAKATITNYGGIVTTLLVPDSNGELGDIVLGCDDLQSYVADSPYFGCLVGRYGNRIYAGKMTVGEQEIQLAINNDGNHLHGGEVGFDKVVWDAEEKATDDGPSLVLNYVSKDGEENYPGTLTVQAIYTLTNDNALKLDFTASTDKTTVCNLTHHSYFHLAGPGNGTILDHKVMIYADRFTPVNEALIPTGELRPVVGTPFDFTSLKKPVDDIGGDDEQLKLGGGFDHNWILNKDNADLTLAARVEEESTGRVLEVLTTEPAMQFYSGNFLDGTIKGKGGVVYPYRGGFCMEPQHYPDSPNQPDFPSTLLSPGETYKNTIIYKFSTV
jgi:aldose 1-epimerase